jgi:hypothetical protein
MTLVTMLGGCAQLLGVDDVSWSGDAAADANGSDSASDSPDVEASPGM